MKADQTVKGVRGVDAHEEQGWARIKPAHIASTRISLDLHLWKHVRVCDERSAPQTPGTSPPWSYTALLARAASRKGVPAKRLALARIH